MRSPPNGAIDHGQQLLLSLSAETIMDFGVLNAWRHAKAARSARLITVQYRRMRFYCRMP